MTDSTEALEQLTQAFGREIFARLDHQGPMLLTPAWLDERLMEWTMHDESVKTQLFRFIDVLPQLNDPLQISGHLREYFGEVKDALPLWARWGMHWLPTNGTAARFVSKLARSNARRLAKKFISGSNVEKVVSAVAALRRRSLGFTVDLLGEATITELEAKHHQESYLKLIDGLTEQVNYWPVNPLIDSDHRGPIPRVNISIKLSSLYSQFDPIDPEGTSKAVRDRLRPIFVAAKERQAFINIDMEQYSHKNLTLRILKEILEEDEFRNWPDVGVAIQAYLRDCEQDMHELLDWVKKRGTPLWVRLIKGAYWDFETIIAEQEGWPVPVFTGKSNTDANYERMTRFLLQNHQWLRPAFGSHNVRSLAYVMAMAQHLSLPKGSFEIQMLYGMADRFMDAFVSLGVRVRVYTPYGELLPGMAYLVRRLLENTANTSFLRASFTENTPEEQLLMNPETMATDENVRNGMPKRAGQMEGDFKNEPVLDFSRDDNRRMMMQALAAVKKQFGKDYPLVIAGKRISTQDQIASANPSRKDEIVGRCGKATIDDANHAIEAAKKRFPQWRDTSPLQRAQYLDRAAGIMRKRRCELAAWQVYECGKQWREADADVCEAIDFCIYYAQQLRKLAEPQRVDLAGEENETTYIPRGVVVVIAPWNFPLAILTGMTAAALVTGNTVIMKPAEQSSVIAAKLMEILMEIDLPDGVVNFLPGVGEEIGPTLVNHPDVAMISFTGSRTVGLLINKEAADAPPAQEHVKRVIAEMGGKNAIIVDDDADLDEAVSAVAKSAFGYQGQKCSACSRAIVLASIHDQFLERLVEATRSLKIAPADDPGSKIGPVIDDESRQRILKFISKGKEQADCVYAGDIGELAQNGHFVGPHIFANVQPDDVIAQEEIFGPVLAVMKAANLDDALAIANGTKYALTGGFFSRSPANIKKVRERFRVGNLYINRQITGALVHRQPFGGFKLSGAGTKAGGPDYLLQFMMPRTITENTVRRGFAPPDDD